VNERLSLFCLAAAMLSVSANSNSAPTACSAASGSFVPTVAELITSEGCEQLPPADRWFSSLKDEAAIGQGDSAFLSRRLLGLASWWKDRFGDSAVSARHSRCGEPGRREG